MMPHKTCKKNNMLAVWNGEGHPERMGWVANPAPCKQWCTTSNTNRERSPPMSPNYHHHMPLPVPCLVHQALLTLESEDLGKLPRGLVVGLLCLQHTNKQVSKRMHKISMFHVCLKVCRSCLCVSHCMCMCVCVRQQNRSMKPPMASEVRCLSPISWACIQIECPHCWPCSSTGCLAAVMLGFQLVQAWGDAGRPLQSSQSLSTSSMMEAQLGNNAYILFQISMMTT